MEWLISANSKMYDHASSFEHYGYIDWRQGNITYSLDDIIFIYCTSPIQKIRYKCKIEKINLVFSEIRNDREYWTDIDEYEKSKEGKYIHLVLIDQVDLDSLSLNHLLENGLTAAPQGPIKINEKLLSYINKNFDDSKQNDFFPDSLDNDKEIFEGLKKSVVVNKYERSSIARSMCIQYHGAKCAVCGIDFSEKYGDLGKGFIHVHHVTPIHKIDEKYRVDYKSDLIPVCPNCHSMLHRKFNNKYCSIKELREIVES